MCVLCHHLESPTLFYISSRQLLQVSRSVLHTSTMDSPFGGMIPQFETCDDELTADNTSDKDCIGMRVCVVDSTTHRLIIYPSFCRVPMSTSRPTGRPYRNLKAGYLSFWWATSLRLLPRQYDRLGILVVTTRLESTLFLKSR